MHFIYALCISKHKFILKNVKISLKWKFKPFIETLKKINAKTDKINELFLAYSSNKERYIFPNIGKQNDTLCLYFEAFVKVYKKFNSNAWQDITIFLKKYFNV